MKLVFCVSHKDSSKISTYIFSSHRFITAGCYLCHINQVIFKILTTKKMFYENNL